MSHRFHPFFYSRLREGCILRIGGDPIFGLYFWLFEWKLMREVKSVRFVFAKFQNNLNSDVIDSDATIHNSLQAAQTRTIPT